MKSIGLLIAGGIAAWLLLIGPGYLIWENAAFIQSLVALGLCLIPAVGTMAWALRAGHAPDALLLAILGGTGVRLAIVLGGGFLLTKGRPDLFPEDFWIWVGAFYLVFLTLEIVLALGIKPKSVS